MLGALAVVGATYAFGVLGILLGPLVVSLIAALVEDIERGISASRHTAKPLNEGTQPAVGTADQ
jgi:predicted PurR-regulated permease PerM